MKEYKVKKVKSLQSCLTLCDPMDLQPSRLLCPQDSLGKNTGVCCHAVLQGIFPTQELNPGLPHCGQILYHLSHQRSLKGYGSLLNTSFTMLSMLTNATQHIKKQENVTHMETVIKSQMMQVPHMTKLTFLRISPSPQTCRLVLRVVVQHKPTELTMVVLRCKHIVPESMLLTLSLYCLKQSCYKASIITQDYVFPC